MKMNNRFLFGILSIVLAAIIAFIAIPAITSKTSSTALIVRMTSDLERGSLITESDVEIVEVGSFNLPPDIATKTEDIVGYYAAASLMAGDYILSHKVSRMPISSDPALNNIPDGMLAISVSTQTLATALSDKLQSNDIVRLYYYSNNNELTPVQDIPELRFLKVLGVTDTKGLTIDYTTPPKEEEEKLQTATLTVLATPEQAALLTRCENEGVLHAALISRGNDALSEELLLRQADILTQLYSNGLETDETIQNTMETEWETTAASEQEE